VLGKPSALAKAVKCGKKLEKKGWKRREEGEEGGCRIMHYVHVMIFVFGL